jgi:hypothetical protein
VMSSLGLVIGLDMLSPTMQVKARCPARVPQAQWKLKPFKGLPG